MTSTSEVTVETREELNDIVTRIRAITWEVRLAMQRKKMTRAELSRLSGLSPSTLDRRLNDTGRTWTVPELVAVAEHLDTTIVELAEQAEMGLRVGRWMSDARAKAVE